MDFYFQGMAWVNKGLRPDWLRRNSGAALSKAKAIDDTNLEALIGIGLVDTLRGVACAGDNPAGALSFSTERYRSLAFSDHRRYLSVRERTIQALLAIGVP